jgi:hypothetical protein
MLKRNTASPYCEKIKAAEKAYKRALCKERQEEIGISRAALAFPALRLRARSAVKNIASYGKLSEREEQAFPLAAAFFERNEEMSEKSLYDFLAEKGGKFGAVALSLLPDALFTVAFLEISRRFCLGEGEGISRYIIAAEKLQFIDFTRIFLAFSASVQIFSAEKAGVFADCDDKTKLKYISALLSLCKREGREETEMAAFITAKADAEGRHVGELIFTKKAYVGRTYALCLAMTVALVSSVYFLVCGGLFAVFTVPAAALAAYGAVKELLSLCFKHAGGDGLMRMSAARARQEKAVVAIMSIITGKESDGELFNRLEDFYLAEQNPNRFYAIVCNLPDSLRKKTAADEKIISSAIARVEALNAKYGEHFGIFVRERKYSRSEQKYIGWERKRGAVLELCRFMRGEKTSVFR